MKNENLSEEWLHLVNLAMRSDCSKDSFKAFLKRKQEESLDKEKHKYST